MPTLSVTIITLNEQKYLPLCLESVNKLKCEIVLVDCGSTDKTLEIAKKFGAKVYYRKFDNYANQKNYAQSLASGDWILSLDADEELSPGLSSEIEHILSSDNLRSSSGDFPVAFTIPRVNIIFGRKILHTRWQPELDRHIWLWRKGAGNWSGDVHEEVVVRGLVGKLKYSKIHHQYDSVAEFLEMMNRYSDFEANQLNNNKVQFSLLKCLFTAKYNFLVRFVYRLGFLDGWRGFVLSYLMAIYQLEVWFKVWALRLETRPAS